MDSNIDFKNIWQQQNISQPNIEEILNKLKEYKNSSLRKLIIANILLITTSGFIIFIWYYYQPQFISTKVGIVLIIFAMVVYLFVYNKQFSIFKKIDNTLTISKYLQNLSALKRKQKFMQTTMIRVYFIMLSTGLGLYMYEYASRMTPLWAILTYAIIFIWIGFNWFYITPATIKTQQLKLNELIYKFKTINEQLEEKSHK